MRSRDHDEALKKPLSITREGRDDLVVLAVEECHQLRQRRRVAFKTDKLSEADVQAITSGEIDARHDHLNAELD